MKFEEVKRFKVIITYEIEYDKEDLECLDCDEVVKLAEQDAVTGMGEQNYEIYGEDDNSTDWESIEE